jgi:hypothetical protein
MACQAESAAAALSSCQAGMIACATFRRRRRRALPKLFGRPASAGGATRFPRMRQRCGSGLAAVAVPGRRCRSNQLMMRGETSISSFGSVGT